jgi:hypothetical protein
VRRTITSVASAVLVVGLLAGCGSKGGDDAATANGASYTAYCAALHRMNSSVGSLGTARAHLDDKAAAARAIDALRDVRAHAPGTLPRIWQKVIDGFREEAIVEASDRTALIKAAASQAAKQVPAGATHTQVWEAIGKASYRALRQDQQADAPHEKRATVLLKAVPYAVGSAQGVCGLNWQEE